MSSFRRKLDEDHGAALLSTLLVLLLLSAITVGVTALVITDTRVRTLDGTRTRSFYTAHAGLEKLTADLGDLFSNNVAPTGAQITALTLTPPALGAVWQHADGTNGYQIQFPTDAGGNPVAAINTVNSGAFQGLVGLATPYQVNVTARLPDGSEANLTRTFQTVAIPVFQFGLFSENDLSFFAGPNFNFGGRVHTNQNLWVAEGGANTLTLADRVTAWGEIVRQTLSNGWLTSAGYTGVVNVITAPAAFRDLTESEGSVVGGLPSGMNEPTWTNLSTGTYNSNIMNGRTGAKQLILPITSFGAGPIDLIKRPVVNENATNPNVLSQRFFTLASLRILLSDTAAEILNLPGVTGAAPVQLGVCSAALPVLCPAGYVGAPFADAPVAGTNGIRVPPDTPLLGGFIKIEMQNAAGAWQDVTLEILNLGIASRQWPDPITWASPCAGAAEPYPNAILRIERLRDSAGTCRNGSVNADDYLPQVLYDPREGNSRDNVADAEPMRFGGIVHYVELDARNLSRWFQGAIGASGVNALNVNGFTVYFSDRRGNKNGVGVETGEYGHEDFVNPASATGAPNAAMDVGEDVNGNGILDVYGQTPQVPFGVGGWGPVLAPLGPGARPWSNLDPGNVLAQSDEINIARRNPAIFFRRALKVTNGALGNLVAPGLTISTENPIYVQGNWNANNAGFGNPHVATAFLADSLTLLSNNWNDRISFLNPHQQSPRDALTTWYRFAVISGKGLSFPWIAGQVGDYGTDGGAHNFLRFMEDWGSGVGAAGQQLNYRGSIASFFTSRQGVGIYKCCGDVYSPPTRGYNFDTEFLTPALLPPRTPMFRDVNTTGFAQIIRPQ